MHIYRRAYVQNGQMFTGFTHHAPRLGAFGIILMSVNNTVTACSPNNWLRRIFYFCGAPRRWIRAV